MGSGDAIASAAFHRATLACRLGVRGIVCLLVLCGLGRASGVLDLFNVAPDFFGWDVLDLSNVAPEFICWDVGVDLSSDSAAFTSGEGGGGGRDLRLRVLPRSFMVR